jgi:hypothetical protein
MIAAFMHAFRNAEMKDEDMVKGCDMMGGDMTCMMQDHPRSRSAMPARRVRSAPDGSTRCSRRNQPVSSRLPSPTRRRGSPGRCSSGRKIIGFRCLLLHERPVQTRQTIVRFSLGRVIMS